MNCLERWHTNIIAWIYIPWTCMHAWKPKRRECARGIREHPTAHMLICIYIPKWASWMGLPFTHYPRTLSLSHQPAASRTNFVPRKRFQGESALLRGSERVMAILSSVSSFAYRSLSPPSSRALSIRAGSAVISSHRARFIAKRTESASVLQLQRPLGKTTLLFSQDP